MKTFFLSCVLGIFVLYISLECTYGQTAPYCIVGNGSGGAGSITASIDLKDINANPSYGWVAVGGGASPSLSSADCAAIAAGGSNTGIVANFYVPMANGSAGSPIIVTVSSNTTINGNFDIPFGSTGDNTELLVSGGGSVSTTLHVTGDLGDASNNKVIFGVASTNDHIVVGLTLYAKNSVAFIGPGTISGTTLNIGNGGTCDDGTGCTSGCYCSVSGNFTKCINGGGSTFCLDYGVPILLSSFNALVKDQAVELNWATDAEINFSHFVVEKSSNGLTFNHLVDVPGSGNSNTRKYYSYTDHNPFIGNSYYRLTSIDFDGYTEVFNNNVVRVNVNAGKNFFIAPNPIQGLTLKAGINFDGSSNSHLVIYDRMGSIIGRYNLTGSEFELQLPNLTNGVYFAQLQSEGFTKSVRFIVNP